MSMQPVSYLLGLLPPIPRTIAECLFSLIAVCSTIVGLTSKRDAAWAKALRLISGVVHPNEDGTIKIPFTTIVLGVTASTAPAAARKTTTPPLLILLVLAVLPSCSGVQSISASGNVTDNPTSGDISAGIGVTITFAQVADGALQPFVAADSQLNATQKSQVETGLTDAHNVLSLLQDANNAYQRVASAANKCRLIAAVDAVINSRMDVITTLLGFAVPIPPQAQAAIQAVGAMADSLLGVADPSCSSGAPMTARSGSRLDTIRARLRLQ